jgi:hypothetical protein
MPAPLFWLLLPGHVALVTLMLLRAVWQGNPAPVWRGLRHALEALPEIWAERRRVQTVRRVSAWQIARALHWAPWRLLDRNPPGL